MQDFMANDFDITKIALACYVAAGTGTPVHMNRPFHGLALNLAGIKEYIFEEDKHILVKKNSIIYMPKNSNYKVKDIEIGDCYAINFDIAEPVSFKPFVFNVKNSILFIESFKSANAKWGKKQIGYHMKCKSELYNIIYNMKKEFYSKYISKSKFSILKPAITYIHNEYTKENISIKYLSEMCGISEAYFRRLFVSCYGVSPLKYINNLKFARAKELIESGYYSISKVAELSGFHDTSYFSKEFKKVIGVCPSEYK